MCLQSVANQTMTEGIECIIVDDCGGDKSIDIARSFIECYSGNIDFKIIYRDYNGGLSAARNTGINAANGEYLYFLDSDDEITPDCMELMYSYIGKNGKIDLVQGSFFESDMEKITRSTYNFPEYTTDRKTIKSFLLRYEGDIVGAQSRLVKRELIFKNNLFFKNGIIHEDNYWTFFLAKYVTSMSFCSIRTYFHRYNPCSITGNVNVQKEIDAYKTIIESLSLNVDSFLPGHQKELILNNLLTVISCHYYKDKEELNEIILSFKKHNTLLEQFFLSLYFVTRSNIILHLLIRLYKVNE